MFIERVSVRVVAGKKDLALANLIIWALRLCHFIIIDSACENSYSLPLSKT